METTEITAEFAAKQAEIEIANNALSQFEHIMARIKNKFQNGEFDLYIDTCQIHNGHIYLINIEKLKSIGFEIKDYTNTGIKISWLHLRSIDNMSTYTLYKIKKFD